MWPNRQEIADLVTFTEESLTENVIFYAVNVKKKQLKETILLQKCKKKFSFNILVLQLLGPTRWAVWVALLKSFLVNLFVYNIEKWQNMHLRCSHYKVFEALLAIFIIMHEINNGNAIKLPNQYLSV